MKEGKYTGYSVEDLLQDQEFISVINGIRTTEEWEQFLGSQKGSKKNILQAKKIIRLFDIKEEVLSGDKKYELWKNIHAFYIKFSRKEKLHKITTYAKIAASVFIIITIGSLLYLRFNSFEKQYHFSESVRDLKFENPLLVLSNGNKVELEKDESRITVLKGQDAIQINHENIVDNQPSSGNGSTGDKLNEVIVPFGKKSELMLEDGTKVWLNAGSRFAFPQEFEGGKRTVYLEGEAYFEVTADADQPFVLSVDDIDIEVLGTKFNVCAYKSDDFSETVLLNGSIQIREKNRLFKDRIVLIPSQKATYHKTDNRFDLTTDPLPEAHIAWIEGWYQFTNENLEQVLKKLERYYNIRFQYDHAVVSGVLPVSGKLDLKDSLEEVMAVLSGVAKFEYQIAGARVLINK